MSLFCYSFAASLFLRQTLCYNAFTRILERIVIRYEKNLNCRRDGRNAPDGLRRRWRNGLDDIAE